jgi:tetratricopeptide (TPR) repeat protein
MFGRGKIPRRLKSLPTAELGIYPRVSRESNPKVLGQILEELGGRNHDGDWANAALDLGSWFHDLGFRDEAISCFEGALHYYESHEDWLGVGRANIALQGAYQRCAEPDYEAAAGHNEAASEAFGKAGDRRESAWCEKEKASLLWQRAIDKNERVSVEERMSLLLQAVQTCQTVIPTFRMARDESRLADCLMTRSYALLELGNSEEAVSGFSEAKAIFQKQGDSMSAMLCDNWIV